MDTTGTQLKDKTTEIRTELEKDERVSDSLGALVGDEDHVNGTIKDADILALIERNKMLTEALLPFSKILRRGLITDPNKGLAIADWHRAGKAIPNV